MLNLNHKKLDVWKTSLDFIAKIYEITKDFPKEEIYGITNQMRRASVSITSNIAEGSSRKSVIERKRFYEIARSSLVEIDAQIEISNKLGLLTLVQLKELDERINYLFAKLCKLIQKQ